MATLAERIKTLRKNAGLTQQEFGSRFGVAKTLYASTKVVVALQTMIQK